MLTIADAFDDPKLFGPSFSGSSWRAWRAVLKGAFGLGSTMSEAERETFRELAKRDPPRGRVKEFWVIAGMRAGKDSIASLIGGYAAAFVDYRAGLRPGESASVLCLACDRAQAKIVLKYTKAYFRQIKLLRHLVVSETSDGLELSTGAELMIGTNTFRGIRGRSIALAILDECAFWKDETSASPDIEVYNAIKPATATIEGSMIVGISSPYRRAGLLYDKWRKHFGKDDDDVLVIHAPTRALNPTVDEKTIHAALEDDPAAARANWFAEWRDDLASFIDRELIESLIDPGVVVRPPAPGVRYVGFADPSGGRADSFTLGISHAEGDTIVLDCLVEIAPPFKASVATGTIVETLKSYRLRSVVGDNYAAEWVRDAFERCGVEYKKSERDRSSLYAHALPLFTSGRARLLDSKRFVYQIASLERRTSPQGRDRINHPAGGHDDLCNAACGALVLASGSGPSVCELVSEMKKRNGGRSFGGGRPRVWGAEPLSFLRVRGRGG
jgi:hypothetical protein